MSKMKTMKLIRQEFDALKNDVVTTLGVTANFVNSDAFHWKVTMIGPQDTCYASGCFTLTIDFPMDYPNTKPEVKFKNKMYHLNVSDNGHVCINTLNDWNSRNPKPTIAQVLGDIFALFYNQNPKDAYHYANEWNNNRAQFERNAREWTAKYAKPF